MSKLWAAAGDGRSAAHIGMMWRWLALFGYFGLFFLLIAWTAWLSPPERIPIAAVLLLLVGPLLFPLRGLLHGRPYTYIWASLLALGYFAAGVFNVAGEMVRPWLGWLEIGCSVMMFAGAMGYARGTSTKAKASPGL